MRRIPVWHCWARGPRGDLWMDEREDRPPTPAVARKRVATDLTCILFDFLTAETGRESILTRHRKGNWPMTFVLWGNSDNQYATIFLVIRDFHFQSSHLNCTTAPSPERNCTERVSVCPTLQGWDGIKAKQRVWVITVVYVGIRFAAQTASKVKINTEPDADSSF